MATFKSQTNQTVIDVCLQTYGDLNKIYTLISDSSFASIMVYPKPQTVFTFNDQLVADSLFASYLKTNKITINTGVGTPISEVDVLGTDDDGFILGDDSGNWLAPD